MEIYIVLKLQTTIEELLQGLSSKGRYDHLKMFLSRENIKHEFPMYFLYIGRDRFGKVRLDDLGFDGTQIHLSIEDCSTGFKKVVQLDIEDKEFQLLLIDWNDIRSLVLAENKSMHSNDELLEFE